MGWLHALRPAVALVCGLRSIEHYGGVVELPNARFDLSRHRVGNRRWLGACGSPLAPRGRSTAYQAVRQRHHVSSDEPSSILSGSGRSSPDRVSVQSSPTWEQESLRPVRVRRRSLTIAHRMFRRRSPSCRTRAQLGHVGFPSVVAGIINDHAAAPTRVTRSAQSMS